MQSDLVLRALKKCTFSLCDAPHTESVAGVETNYTFFHNISGGEINQYVSSS